MADPTRVVICGSLAYPDLIAAAVEAERAAGREVIAWPNGDRFEPQIHVAKAWRRHIEAADEVVIVRPPVGPLGDDVRRDRDYALELGRRIRWASQELPPLDAPAADTTGWCQARIWPSWAPHEVPCGSRIIAGRCAKYHHPAPPVTVGEPMPAADTGMSVDEAVRRYRAAMDDDRPVYPYVARLVLARLVELEAMKQRAREMREMRDNPYTVHGGERWNTADYILGEEGSA